jgi:flagellar biosynthesis anti-sigma factor FlgM
MKIEGNRPNLENAPVRRLDRVAGDATRIASGAKVGAGDRFAVSAEAALANEAAKAAIAAPDIRTELVERMRALMASGELGSDASGLADHIIDSLMRQR